MNKQGTNREQTGDSFRARLKNKPCTNREQTGNKPGTVADVSRETLAFGTLFENKPGTKREQNGNKA